VTAELIGAVVAMLCAVAGAVIGRIWGCAEGRRAGRQEAERAATIDNLERLERGRAAVVRGRDSGDDLVERVRRNDGRW
jgi:hypothetical protein